MIRDMEQAGRRRLTDLLLVVVLLLCPAVLHAQTDQLDDTDTPEISAGTPGLTMTIYGIFPINKGTQTPMCFFTVSGTSGIPLIPLTGDFSSPTLVELQIPAGSIQEIPASAFNAGVFTATAYATANASDTCDGKIDPAYTNTLQIPIQEPAVLSTDLDTLTARNPSLSGNPAPREIYLQGTDFVAGEAAVTFSGSSFSSFAGAVTVVSSISARVDVPANLPAGVKSVDLTYCTHTATADYCAPPVPYPIQQLASNPGTLTATPSPTAPATPTNLQAVFGSTDGFGVPSGLVTFTDGTATLGTAPLTFTSGQFVATNPSAAAPGEFEGSPQSILADLNQDGLQDVILYAPNTVQIYYAADNLGGFGFVGRGSGFTGTEFALDNDFCLNVVAVTTADFNGDGYPDIAMLCTDPASGGATDNVLVYLNQKDGTFSQESAIFAAPSAHLIAAADFNRDGNTDILLVGPDGNMNPDGSPVLGFNIYPGDGAGGFGGSTPFDVPLGDGLQVAAVDFNNDGFPDIALLYHDFSSDLSTSQIEVFQNDSMGNFPATPTYQKSLGDTGATFQFFTPTLPGSKYPNLVAINGGIDASIAVVFNNQTPAIGFSDTIFTAPVPGLLTAAMGDFNGDGFQDVAVYDGSNLSVYNADATGQYNQPLSSFTLATSVNSLLGSSDANGDGYSDPIAFITPSGDPSLVQQYITSGTATATLGKLTFAAGPHSLTATTPGTPTLSPGTASATLVSNGSTQIQVSNAVLTTSPTSPTTYAPANPVTLTVEVDSLAAPAPTGPVQFFNSLTNTLLGTVNLAAASSTQSFASLPIGTLTAGDYSFSAVYEGDTTYFPATIGAVDFQVNQATPLLAFVPNPATITFGTALSAAQLDATATLGGNTVAGSFVYTNASGTAVNTTTVLPGGSNNITATFTPTDTTDYKTPAGVTSTITVNKATPVVAFVPNPATLASGAPLTGAQLDATAAFGGSAVPGSFVYTNAGGATVSVGTVLPAGPNVITANFTPSNTTNFNVPAGAAATITVSAATTTLVFVPNPATITFGTALSTAQLDATATSGGSSVAGTFIYTNASGTVVNTTTTLPAGPSAITVNFTPADTTGFTTPAAVTSTITINKATPTVSWTAPAAILYGTALSGTQLNATASFNGMPVAGTFSYNPASGTVLAAGTNSLGVTFTPADAADFNVAAGSTSITVGQATPTIAWTAPASISYGTALSGTQLNATATFNGATVAGAFSYNPASGTVLTAGTHTLGVTFTPTDTTDFAVATGSVGIAVGQSTPVVIWAPPATINLGAALGAAQLNASVTGVGGAALAGTFTYAPAAGVVLPVGANTLGVTFTPTDTVDYTTAVANVPLTVNPAPTTTTVTSSMNPSQFGQLVTFTVGVTSAYSGAAITGTVSVFDGTTLLGTVQLPNLTVSTSTLSAGAHSITAVYGGNSNFGGSNSAVLTETISSATTAINWPQPASVPYGAKLSATQLNATVSTAFAQTVPGTFAYTPAAGALLTAGPQTLSVLFTPTDTASFKTATASVTLVVTKVAPTLSWAAAANITAGTPLGATQLNATATDIGGNPLPGVFTYTPSSGTILAPGATTLSAAFAPTDTVDYTPASISIPLNVDPAIATVAVISTANPSQFGQPVTFNVNIASAYTASPISGTVTISDGKTVLGTPALTNGAASFAISTLTAGAHNITASFAGNPVFAAATSPVLAQTVDLATSTITWPTPTGIGYGTLLSATQLNATVATPYAATVPGTFVYTPAAGTLLTAGTQTLSVAFTPTDTIDFKPATGSVTIAVGKIAPTITWSVPADVVAGTVLSATQLNATANGISGALTGAFAYTPALGTVLTAGTQTLSVTFTPTDLTDYTTATATVPLNVIGLALTSLSTASVKLGDPALNLTLTGTGFLPNSVVYIGTTALTTTFVNPTTLTVAVPASNFLTAQTLQVTVNDPTQAQTSNTLAIVVGAPPATISVNGPPTVAPVAQPNLTFTVAAYAVPIAATLTLTFTPAPGLTTDGTILFPNGTTTTTFTIPANTTTIPPLQFQSGSVAGTITVTLKLTAGGVDITPTPVPTLVITSPPATPGVAGVTLDRSGDTLTVTVQGYSNTRDIEQIHFHFVAAPGQSLATSDLVIDGSALFSAWYSNPASPTYGSTFHYIQVFNLDQDAAVVGQVQVTLVNSQGNSQTVSAQ